jgi:hypothetical protein
VNDQTAVTMGLAAAHFVRLPSRRSAAPEQHVRSGLDSLEVEEDLVEEVFVVPQLLLLVVEDLVEEVLVVPQVLLELVVVPPPP